MRIVGTISAFAVLTPAITAFLAYLELGSSSPRKKAGIATVIEVRSSIPEQYPSGSDLRQNDCGGPNHSASDSTAVSERKTLMYAIKTIHEPFKMPYEMEPLEPTH